MSLQVVTANRLRDGIVVYLAADGGWRQRVADAALALDQGEAERLMALASAAVEARLVVDPYLIEVVEDGGLVRPSRYREVIRATGPSVETQADLPSAAE
ncbi:MAG: DUF2849 domain-containing protein [Alphaproteobacteria bacterium]|jgi:hypothetical protein|nr:DUF2849 domain-containing protein [Alphaproteobacteria bacterium]